MDLLPGMTASISFEVDSTNDVPKIPNAALRFFPEESEWVREEDRYLIDGTTWKRGSSSQQSEENEDLTANEKAEAERKKNQRHVWVVDGKTLRAVSVVTGLTENRFTELIEGDLKPGDALVTGQEE
jgi:HlyD family secretion protein